MKVGGISFWEISGEKNLTLKRKTWVNVVELKAFTYSAVAGMAVGTEAALQATFSVTQGETTHTSYTEPGEPIRIWVSSKKYNHGDRLRNNVQ